MQPEQANPLTEAPIAPGLIAGPSPFVLSANEKEEYKAFHKERKAGKAQAEIVHPEDIDSMQNGLIRARGKTITIYAVPNKKIRGKVIGVDSKNKTVTIKPRNSHMQFVKFKYISVVIT